jgi:hypothetical protein
MRTRAPSRRYDSVQQDWRALLPEAQASLFYAHTSELENDYLMLSVSLNECLDSYQKRAAVAAHEPEVLCALCSRLAIRTNAVLHGMWQHARHFGITPNLSPLVVENFKSEQAQREARYSLILNHVLLSERSQFLNKVSTLEEIVDQLCDEFIVAASALEGSTRSETSGLLGTLDSIHFDLNTCVRETDVLLKSFIIVLPYDQLEGFDFTVNGLARARRPQPAAAAVPFPAGRITFAPGQ